MTFRQERYRVYLKSFGCSSNIADGEFMAGCLAGAGFELVDTEKAADFLVYNTCAVKTPTENRVIETLKKARQMRNRQLLVTGCLPLINPKRLKNEVQPDAVLGSSPGPRVVEVLQKIIGKSPVSSLEHYRGTKLALDLPRVATNPVVAIVPVAQGCLGSCSYCCVVLARGPLRSCTQEDVLQRVRVDLSSGVREIWLTSQDTGSYGRDIGFNLPKLLKSVCRLEGNYWVRVGMMTPNMISDILPDLIEAFRDKHIFKFLHLPVQSGNNDVLKRMNRLYSVDEFRRIIEDFRDAIPNLTLATDVICGFPSENKDAFEATLSLIENISPDIVNISKFFPRPNTAAEKMTPRIPSTEVNERSRRITSLVRKISFEKNQKWLNWEGSVLIDERGKQPNTFIGRNFAYKPIVVKNNNQSILGTLVDAKVTKPFQTYLEAEIIE